MVHERTEPESNTVNLNAEKWDAIYSHQMAGSFLQHPNDTLVSLFFQNQESINVGGTCLDYGFGSANNSEFLLRYFSVLYGVEIARSSIDIARRRLNDYCNFNPALFTARRDLEGFEGLFDLVVAWQVLCYNDAPSLNVAIRSLHASLKPGGIIITSLTTHRDVKTKFARRVAPNTFAIDERIPQQHGCRIFALDHTDEFVALFDAFEVLDVGCYERRSCRCENTLSEHYLVARKR